ncbi:hypothetical protein [Bacteroides hominis]
MPPMTSLLPNEFMASLMLKLTGGWFRCGASFPEGRKGSRVAGGVGLAVGYRGRCR